MKNSLTIAVLIALGVLITAAPATAATATAGPITVSAGVNGSLSLTLVMRKNSSAGAVITTMDFGQLMDIGTGTLRSSPTGTTATGSVDCFLTANSHGLQYAITQTGTSLSNGINTLPSGACTVVPIYAAADNGGATMPAGAALGTPGSWVATNKPIYTSEAGTAALRTIQAGYAITDDPTAGATTGVPLSQPGGTYTGSITFTVTA